MPLTQILHRASLVQVTKQTTSATPQLSSQATPASSSDSQNQQQTPLFSPSSKVTSTTKAFLPPKSLTFDDLLEKIKEYIPKKKAAEVIDWHTSLGKIVSDKNEKTAKAEIKKYRLDTQNLDLFLRMQACQPELINLLHDFMHTKKIDIIPFIDDALLKEFEEGVPLYSAGRKKSPSKNI